MLLRKLASLAVPTSVALAAFSLVHATGSLVDAAAAPSSIAPFAEARAATDASGSVAPRSAGPLLERNPFEHATGSLRRDERAADAEVDPRAAPPCEGVRAVAAVRGEEPEASFAALDVAGEGVLRRRGGSVADLRVVYIGADRVWLEQNGALCQARVL
ncbi:MAG: hypothetical protein KF782_13385 [Labilithrix sp.]|nr:hypothetical protein [Labilithrix sp.]